MTDIHACDIRLLSKKDLRLRVRELLTAEDQYCTRIAALEAALRAAREILIKDKDTAFDSHSLGARREELDEDGAAEVGRYEGVLEVVNRALGDSPSAIPEAKLVEAHFDESGLDFRLRHPIVPTMAAHLAEAFKSAGGVNYVTFDIYSEDIGALTLTMQRRSGETPEKQAARYRRVLAYYAAPDHWTHGDVPGHIYAIDDGGCFARGALGMTQRFNSDEAGKIQRACHEIMRAPEPPDA